MFAVVAVGVTTASHAVNASEAADASTKVTTSEPDTHAGRAGANTKARSGEEAVFLGQPQTLVLRESQPSEGERKVGEVWQMVLALIAVGGSFGGVWLGQRLGFDLAGDSLVLKKRIRHYERMFVLLKKLPKYPEPLLLSMEDIFGFANVLQEWYFGGGGLYMNVPVRDAYFDLQDGIRIVLARHGKIRLLEPLPTNASDAVLWKALERPEGSKVPEEIRDLVGMSRLIDQTGHVEGPALAALRKIGSHLRSMMCLDLSSRRSLGRRSSRDRG